MANEKVMNFVERELAKDPDISSKDLYQQAKKVSSTVRKLTLRQFHAKYPLQVKRKAKMGTGSRSTKGAPRKRKTARARGTGASRRTAVTTSGSASDSVRRLMMDFAREVSAAKGKSQTIDVLASVDRYVNQVLKITQG